MPVRTSFATPAERTVAELRDPGNYTSQAWKRMSRRIRSVYPICQYCERNLSESVDHVNGDATPPHKSDNLASTCSACHSTKTGIFERKGRVATIDTLHGLYVTLATVPAIPPLQCTMFSTLGFLSCLLDNRRRTYKIDDCLDALRDWMPQTAKLNADGCILAYLMQPNDSNIQSVCERMGVKLAVYALTFTNARYQVTQKIA